MQPSPIQPDGYSNRQCLVCFALVSQADSLFHWQTVPQAKYITEKTMSRFGRSFQTVTLFEWHWCLTLFLHLSSYPRPLMILDQHHKLLHCSCMQTLHEQILRTWCSYFPLVCFIFSLMNLPLWSKHSIGRFIRGITGFCTFGQLRMQYI